MTGRHHQRSQTIPPQSEVSGGPRTPLDLSGTGWKNTLKRTGKKFVRDRCSVTAGSPFSLMPAARPLVRPTSLICLFSLTRPASLIQPVRIHVGVRPETTWMGHRCCSCDIDGPSLSFPPGGGAGPGQPGVACGTSEVGEADGAHRDRPVGGRRLAGGRPQWRAEPGCAVKP
jgi:hypothetical protein